MNHLIMFPDRDNKTNLVPVSFSYFLDFFLRKISFSLKRMIVLTVLIAQHYKETN